MLAAVRQRPLTVGDLVGAYAFPATNITFSSTAIYPSPQSALSSTGLDVGDVNKDGFVSADEYKTAIAQ